jgi:hypothetical protein
METANIAVSMRTNHWSQQHFSNGVVHPVAGKKMEYMALMKDPHLQPLWKLGFGNEKVPFQGIHDIPGTYTCLFVELPNIPKDRKITYGKVVCDYKPHKKEKERDILTVGGGRLYYSSDVATSFKLLPLPHPPVRARSDARTNPSAQRATQLRSVLARVYAVSIQNQITPTVP